ncbi:MAG TPA: MBL fold metallo-hydrolase, partial [Steroidobacteraceae bacterium]|nr:MBL fold metallo-hydrolase [Steroidobacteraceae bacterium]
MALAWLVCASAACAEGKDASFKYDIVNVAPGVYAFIEPEMLGIVSGTVVAVVGEDSVLIFDTTHHVSSARNIIADLKRITGKPVKFVINSHWHEDHWTGNAEFAKAYPAATFYAHPFTAEMIEKRRESFRGEHCKQELQT